MTDWEQCYLDGCTPWNKGQPSPPMEEWMSRHRISGRAIVPGCGAGHDVAMLCRHGLEAWGLDIAPSAIALAKQNHPKNAESMVEGDLFSPPAGWNGSFDYVFEHTCLCALPPAWRGRYEKAVHDLLKTGGSLVGVWFIHPEMDPGEQGPPFGIGVDELGELFPPSRWQVTEDYVPSTGYEGRVGRERLRVLTKIG